MTPNIGNIYIKSKLVKHWSRIQGSYLKNQLYLTGRWLESRSFTMEPYWKNCDSSGMMGMDEKFSSRAVEWRWNHDDLTARSLKILLESHSHPSVFRVSASDCPSSCSAVFNRRCLNSLLS